MGLANIVYMIIIPIFLIWRIAEIVKRYNNRSVFVFSQKSLFDIILAVFMWN